MDYEYQIDRYVKRLRNSNNYFRTFIDRPSLAVGVLILNPGKVDDQEPHDSDEVYFVVRGNGFLQIGNKDHAVSAGKVFFVAKNTPHHFHSNTEELVVVYFFGCSDSP